MTAAEELILEGWKKGKAEGKAELLTRLLKKRFGKLPKTTLERLDSAAEVHLDLWTERLLSARTLADVIE